MPVWEIIGPVMIGPSSSHTAGAVRLGNMVRTCWGADVKKADIYMRGSFAETGCGHGTDRAILAGLLGRAPDDPDVRRGIEIAISEGLEFNFYEEEVDDAHANSARFVLSDENGRVMEAVGASTGGGAILLSELDGFAVELTGRLNSVIIVNRDVSGVVGAVTSFLSDHKINIATMKLYRDSKGGMATMVIELDYEGSLRDLEEIATVHPAIIRTITVPAGGLA